jgi:hypothetical protein
VDEHDERFVGNLRERGSHRLGPGRATRDAGDDLRGGQLFGEEDRRFLPARWRGDDDRVDQLAAVETVEALGQERTTAEGGECLRTIDPEPLAEAGGGDQRPGISAEGGNT